MPSNQELIDQINELSKKLDKPVETDGLNNNDLNALVKKLRSELKEYENGAEEAAAVKAETQEAKKNAKPVPAKGLRVCAGKSVTSKKGILDAGSPCAPSDFEGGEGTVNALLKRGILEK